MVTKIHALLLKRFVLAINTAKELLVGTVDISEEEVAAQSMQQSMSRAEINDSDFEEELYFNSKSEKALHQSQSSVVQYDPKNNMQYCHPSQWVLYYKINYCNYLVLEKFIQNMICDSNNTFNSFENHNNQF